MRLGIYGGTFDPVHYGHLLAAEQCREQRLLDEVWFIPAASPPHKQGVEITAGRHRAEMLELATAGDARLKVSRMELDRGGPSYTVDTLARLREEDPSRELLFIIGSDSLSDLPTWRRPKEILHLATVLVVNRGRERPDIGEAAAALGEQAIARIDVISMPAVDLSATDLRRRIRDGRSIRYMTPRAVEMYIREHELYRR